MPNPNPIRIIEGDAQPYARFWDWTPRPQDDAGAPAELKLYGPISEYSWWGDEVTPKKFADDLAKFGAGGPITVRIHSAGGDVFAASAIRAMLSDYAAPVTSRIDGLCASAAVAVAMAGDSIQIQDSAYMMIHQPSYRVLMGSLTAQTMRKVADMLDTVGASIATVYAQRTGLEAAEINDLMDAETWFNAQDAVDKGFADEIISGGKLADMKALQNQIQNYVKTPLEITQLVNQAPDETLSPPRLSAEAESLRNRVNNILKGVTA